MYIVKDIFDTTISIPDMTLFYRHKVSNRHNNHTRVAEKHVESNSLKSERKRKD